MLDSLLFLAAVGLAANGIALRKRFFNTGNHTVFSPTWTGWDALLFLFLYTSLALFFGWLGVRYYPEKDLLPSVQWSTFGATLFTFAVLFGIRVKGGLKWRWSAPSSPPLKEVIGIGLIVFALAIPVVLAIDEGLQWYIEAVLGVKGEEQLAVRYLKMSRATPFSFFTALFTIIIAAPLIEEFLFRGILQSWLKKRFNRPLALILTSLAFSFFHYAASQGASNIPIITSLFVFSLYLGFAYEKTASLWTSITIHSIFNALGVIYILSTL